MYDTALLAAGYPQYDNRKGNAFTVWLAVYTFSHFTVDFCCFFTLFSWLSSGTHSIQTVTLGFFVYNVIAFGLQPVIGYLYDTYRKIPVEIIGFPLLIAGLLSMPAAALSISLIGLGNAFFHIAGGVDSLRNSSGKMARSGVFVSSGALGVAFGSLAGKTGSLPVFIPIGVLLLCLVLLYTCYQNRLKKEDSVVVFSIVEPGIQPGMIILLAAVSIMIRSFAGSVLPTEWRTTTLLFAFPAIGAFLGKFTGGFLADSIGAGKAAVFSLLVSTVLLALGYVNPWIYLTGVIFFNISMSVTLCAIASVLPLNPGLAFGITTLALLCGNVPTFFIATEHYALVFVSLTIISAICLFCILKGKEKINEKISEKNE